MAENKNILKKLLLKFKPELEKVEESEPEEPEISMPAVPEPEPESKESEESEENTKKEIPQQVYSVCLFAIGVLILLLIFVQGSAMWKALHEAIKGFFGISVIFIPVGLFFAVYQMDKSEKKQDLKNQLKLWGIGITFFSCFIEIMFGKGRVLNYNFGQCFKMLYDEGIAWRGGGMLSALAFLILHIFGDVGSKILVCLLSFVVIMILTKKSLAEFFAMLKKPFQNFFNIIHQDRKDEEILKTYEQEQYVHEIQDEQEALAIAEQGANKNHSAVQNNLISIDIPIELENLGNQAITSMSNKKVKTKTKPKAKAKSNIANAKPKDIVIITPEMILEKINSDSVSGLQFEEIVSKILRFNGFVNVETTKASGDNGIDILAEKDGTSYAIQCKCYSKSVGNKAVQEAYTGKVFYQKMIAVVVTNNIFTKPAMETAKATQVLLWDRTKLLEMLNQLSHEDLLELANSMHIDNKQLDFNHLAPISDIG